MLYLWLKALHIIAMVCWFAGLFYLPRLFVYHAMSSDTISHERFCIMERKLSLGIWLLSLNPSYYFSQGWMHAKLTLVIALVIYHHLCGAQLKRFARGENSRGHVFYRWFNEAPVLALLGIVILVVVRPF
jgi:putative membrane protein